MAKVLIVADIHLSDRPPSSCTPSYADDLLDLLLQTVDLAETYRVAAVVWAGDVFHCTAPSRTSHRLVQRTIEVGQCYPCEWFIVPGNHDMSNHRMESVLDTQPLGVLLRAGARLLAGWPQENPRAGLPIYGMPWLQGVYGNDDQDGDDQVVSRALEGYREWGSAGLVIAHAPLYPPGFELPYEFYPAIRWAEAMGGGRADHPVPGAACYYGHVHEAHGVWEAGGVRFANFGALSRGSLHEHNLSRVPSVALWDSETGEFTQLPLRAKPADEVFRLAEPSGVTDTTGKLDAFLESIGAAQLEVVSVESVVAHVRGLGLADEVLAEVEGLLEWSVHQ